MNTLQDALSNTHPIPTNPPQRIVSLVPSLTEMLASLQLDSSVVGITRYCVHPPNWTARKTCVGGTKKARVDSIRDLRPDLVLANKEENIQHEVEAIQEFCPVYVCDISTFDESLQTLRDIGLLTHTTQRARELQNALTHKLGLLQPLSPKQRAVYLIWRNPFMTVGSDTYIHDMMHRAGYINLFATHTRYPQTTLEEIAALQPDTILLSTEPYPFTQEHVDSIQNALQPLQTHVQLVDGEAFSWYGTRLLSIHTLADATFSCDIEPHRELDPPTIDR